jgi:N4-gp56 family major capsid protein
MARTPTPASLTVQQWANDFFTEYVRDNRFKPFMGMNENAIIHIKQDLSKKKGDTLTFQLVNKLSGTGVTGNGTLEGNEEAQASDGFDISVSYLRNAVLRTLEDEQATAINYLNAARVSLKKWMMEKMRDHIITAMMSIDSDAYLSSQIVGNTNYTAVASEADKDAWLAANADRVLFGALKSNNQANDHSASLAELDNTADKLTTTVGGLAKRMAQTATPAISPTQVNGDKEFFVMFCNSNSFRDLKTDAVLTQANREARARNVKSNPIFVDGAEIYNGITYVEVPEIPSIGLVGASSINVGVNFLCGVQAVGVAFAKRATPIMNNTDYGFRKGVGIMEMRGIKKLLFEDPDNVGSNVQHGMVTVYTAAVDDA